MDRENIKPALTLTKEYMDNYDRVFRPKCEVCGDKPATDCHHKLPQTKVYKKLYPDYIHDLRNLMDVCRDCHLSKPIPHYTEREFCEVMGIKPRSKTESCKNNFDTAEDSL